MPHAADPHRRLESPNVELLRADGWAVATVIGTYCVAWRGTHEVVFHWRDGDWRQVSGRTSGRAA